MNITEPRAFLERLVLAIDRRNGGTATSLHLESRFLDPRLQLDSLDLAEVFAQVEREFKVNVFDSDYLPRTWNELISRLGTPADAVPDMSGDTTRCPSDEDR